MKKFLLALMLVLAMALPVLSAPVSDSESWVSGSATQNNGAAISITDQSQGASANGGQNGSASFNGAYSNPSSDSAIGTISLNGGTTVTADIKTGVFNNTSSAYGNTWNNGDVTISGVGTPSGVNTSLNGTGSMQTGTLSVWGPSTNNGNIVTLTGNGAIAGTSTNGAFGYNASSAGPGWIGNGYTTGTGLATTGVIPHGFTATSSSTVISVACPK